MAWGDTKMYHIVSNRHENLLEFNHPKLKGTYLVRSSWKTPVSHENWNQGSRVTCYDDHPNKAAIVLVVEEFIWLMIDWKCIIFFFDKRSAIGWKCQFIHTWISDHRKEDFPIVVEAQRLGRGLPQGLGFSHLWLSYSPPGSSVDYHQYSMGTFIANCYSEFRAIFNIFLNSN